MSVIQRLSLRKWRWPAPDQAELERYHALVQPLRILLENDEDWAVAPLSADYRKLDEYRAVVAAGDEILPSLIQDMASRSDPVLVDLAADITGFDVRSTPHFWPPTTDRAVELWLDWWDARRPTRQ